MILKFQIFILTLILTTKISYCIIFSLYCYPFLFVYSQISFSTQINYVEIWPFWSFWCSELLCLMYAFVSLEYYIHVYKYDILTLYTNIYIIMFWMFLRLWHSNFVYLSVILSIHVIVYDCVTVMWFWHWWINTCNISHVILSLIVYQSCDFVTDCKSVMWF